MRNLALATGLALAASPAPGAPDAAPPPKPALIVAIAVDQFSSDLFNQYRRIYTGGLKRLAEGAVFPAGYQSHAATETCPGHSTILTGSRPARTGIIANDWQNPKLPRAGRDGKPSFDIYCAEKPGTAGSPAMPQEISSDFLKVPTLGDRMKARDGNVRVASVSLKDRAAVMLGGHNADLTFWWDGKRFATYRGQEARTPAAVAAIDARAAAEIAKPAKPLLPKQCAAMAWPVAAKGNADLGVPQPRKPGDERGWRASALADAATLDVALAAKSALALGARGATDLLAISFSATDYVGHSVGTNGGEMCAQIVALDATLGRLFAALDKDKRPYVVVLTADHGGHDLSERNDQLALPQAARVDPMLSAAAVGAALAKQFGLPESALIGRAPFGDIYLSASVPQDKRTAVLEAAVAAYRGHPQVAAVFTAEEIAARPSPSGEIENWTLPDRARASFDRERSGDFVVFLKPYVTPIPEGTPGFVATHGSPWNYDRRVPILFWWPGAHGFEQPNGVETADIMPTLASLIGLDVPADEIDGRCLDIVAGAGTNCP